MAKKQTKKVKGIERFFQIHSTENHTCTTEQILKTIGIGLRILPNKEGKAEFIKMDNRQGEGSDISRYWARVEFTRNPEHSVIKVSRKYNLDTFVEFVSLKIRKNKSGVNSCWIAINSSDLTPESKGIVKIVGEVKYKVPTGSYIGRDGDTVFKYETKTPNNFRTESAWKRNNYEKLPIEYMGSIHTGNLDIIKNAIGEKAVAQGLCNEDAIYNPVWRSDADYAEASPKSEVPASAKAPKGEKEKALTSAKAPKGGKGKALTSKKDAKVPKGKTKSLDEILQ